MEGRELLRGRTPQLAPAAPPSRADGRPTAFATRAKPKPLVHQLRATRCLWSPPRPRALANEPRPRTSSCSCRDEDRGGDGQACQCSISGRGARIDLGLHGRRSSHRHPGRPRLHSSPTPHAHRRRRDRPGPGRLPDSPPGPPAETLTYGLKRVEILSAQVNGITLWLLTAWFIYEAIRRFINPPEVSGGLVPHHSVGRHRHQHRRVLADQQGRPHLT